MDIQFIFVSRRLERVGMGVTIHHQFDLSISAESSDVRGLKLEKS